MFLDPCHAMHGTLCFVFHNSMVFLFFFFLLPFSPIPRCILRHDLGSAGIRLALHFWAIITSIFSCIFFIFTLCDASCLGQKGRNSTFSPFQHYHNLFIDIISVFIQKSFLLCSCVSWPKWAFYICSHFRHLLTARRVLLNSQRIRVIIPFLLSADVIYVWQQYHMEKPGLPSNHMYFVSLLCNSHLSPLRTQCILQYFFY